MRGIFCLLTNRAENNYYKGMTKEEMQRELSLLKEQQKKCQGPACFVYGKTDLAQGIPSRLNGCCMMPAKRTDLTSSSCRKKGFTLLETLIVVFIVVVLFSIALPQYLKAVERSRMTEAVALLANVAQAQELKFAQLGHFVSTYDGLSMGPRGASSDKYCTRGAKAADTYTRDACGPEAGFVVRLSQDTKYNEGKTQALRTGNSFLQYQYELERYYADYGTLCRALNQNGESLCADFCGVDTYTGPCCSVLNGMGGCNGPSQTLP